jgi:hypothetical protein
MVAAAGAGARGSAGVDGLGSVWAERDPELYMGAMIASMLLQPFTEDTEQKIANIKTKLLMRVGMGPRKAILSAKVYADYGDILGERAKGEDTAKAAAILPASKNWIVRKPSPWIPRSA